MSRRLTIGILRGDLINGEGSIKLGPIFQGLSPIMRADILKDIKYEIDAAYEQAVRDLTPKLLREAEH